MTNLSGSTELPLTDFQKDDVDDILDSTPNLDSLPEGEFDRTLDNGFPLNKFLGKQ